MRHWIFLALFSLSPSVFANTYTVCGSGEYTEDGMEFEKLELTLSTSYDDFEGPVGDRWSLRVGEGDWLKKNVTASTFEREGVPSVVFTITQAKSVTGPVGLQYILVDIYSDEPKLEKYSMGGFVGTKLLGTYSCYTAFD